MPEQDDTPAAPRAASLDADVVIVGAGAAGLMAALAARGALDREGRPSPPAADAPRVVLVDGAPKLGLKILVSGGGRCNVTNEQVTDADFDTDAPHVVRGLLAAFPASGICAFLEARGVPLYAEPLGKVFPRSDDAEDVVRALLGAVEEAGIPIETGSAVEDVARAGDVWLVRLADGRTARASRVVVATGGKSLPKTGSTGFGFELARRLGHSLESVLPALTPVLLEPDGVLEGLAGITVPALLSLVPRGTAPEQVSGGRFRPIARSAGSMLVTHQGISGPAALDVSGACGLALARRQEVVLAADFWTLLRDDSPWAAWRDAAKPPGACLPPADAPRPVDFATFLDETRAAFQGGRRAVGSSLSRRLPRSLAEPLSARAGIDPERSASTLTENEWRRLWAVLTHSDLGLAGTAGWDKAEVTRGGVPLAELHRTTLESRLHPGLHFCGEVVNATGRLGGFNFQWAWSSGFAAGRAAAKRA
jgi:predicted Rossmann fold flavoprotein